MNEQTRAAKLLDLRENPMTLLSQLAAGAKSKAVAAAIIVTMAWFLWSWHQHEAAALVLGMWFGAILRDLRTSVVVSSGWPFTVKIINWEIVRSIANGGGETETTPAGSPPTS
jgi:hypothetical protein